MASSFRDFALIADAVAATPRRLLKAKLLATYLAELPDEDLIVAARFFGGTVFPQRDQRTTNIGGAAMFAAVASVSQAEPQVLSARLVALGDFGDVAFESFAASPVTAAVVPTLELKHVAAAFAHFADAGGPAERAAALVRLLEQATPVEAKYLIKLLGGELRIGLREGAVEDALARMEGVSVGQVQWANMLLGDLGETALLARQGLLATARMKLFHPLKFMLASPIADLNEVTRQMPPTFVVEDKYDGIRAQAHIGLNCDVHDGHGAVHGDVRVALFSRTLDEITGSFVDLVEPLASLVTGSGSRGSGGLILDGEIVPMVDGRILPFQALQKRLGRKLIPESVLREVPVAFIAYDLLFVDGEVQIEQSWTTRRRLLEAVDPKHERIVIAPSHAFDSAALLDEEFIAARGRGNEGLMVKDPAATYKPGRRGREWLKIKRPLASLDVVVTAVEVGNGRRAHLLSDYTFAVRASESDGTLLNVGKAYSGLTDVELAEMSIWFKEHTLQEFGHGRVRAVEPLIVIEVTFDLVQPSRRHKSGFALRFPRIVRLRPDKPAHEIDTLQTVQRLADTPAGMA